MRRPGRPRPAPELVACEIDSVASCPADVSHYVNPADRRSLAGVPPRTRTVVHPPANGTVTALALTPESRCAGGARRRRERRLQPPPGG
ncbi:MAG TPA: hypothetical protein VF142_11805 [Longimicrobium sp.]